MVIMAIFQCEACEEFDKEFGILYRAFNSQDICGDLCRGSAMADSCAIQLKFGQDWDVLITVCHHIELVVF